MDRRTFLKSSAAAATFPAGAAVAATSPERDDATSSAPAVAPTHQHWRVARPGDLLLRDQAERLLAQITAATAGAITIDWQETLADTDPTAHQLRSGEIDAAFAIAPDLLADPGLAIFTGLPGPSGLAPENLLAWHTVHGAGTYLDEIAAAHGVKILLAGHTGLRPGLWTNREIADLRDVAETQMTSSGLGQLVWDRIRAPFASAFAGHAREFLAHPACALRDARAAGLTHFFPDGLHEGGIALALVLTLKAWRNLTPTAQTAIETTARAALNEAITVAAFHNQAVTPALTKAGTITPRPLPDLVCKAIDHVSLAVVSEHIARDPRLAPAWSSYEAFHHQIIGRPVPVIDPASRTA